MATGISMGPLKCWNCGAPSALPDDPKIGTVYRCPYCGTGSVCTAKGSAGPAPAPRPPSTSVPGPGSPVSR